MRKLKAVVWTGTVVLPLKKYHTFHLRETRSLREPCKGGANRNLPAFRESFETGDARALDEDMRETSGRGLDSQCMAARGPSISYRAALEVRVRARVCSRRAGILSPFDRESISTPWLTIQCVTGFLHLGISWIHRTESSNERKPGPVVDSVSYPVQNTQLTLVWLHLSFTCLSLSCEQLSHGTGCHSFFYTSNHFPISP